MHGLIDNIEVRTVGVPLAASSSTNNTSDIIDTAGYESVAFIVSITNSIENGVATLTVEENDIDSATGMESVSGAVATATSEADGDLNSKDLKVEYRKPSKRYIRVVRTSDVANIAYSPVVALLKPYRRPVEDAVPASSRAYVSN